MIIIFCISQDQENLVGRVAQHPKGRSDVASLPILSRPLLLPPLLPLHHLVMIMIMLPLLPLNNLVTLLLSPATSPPHHLPLRGHLVTSSVVPAAPVVGSVPLSSGHLW